MPAGRDRIELKHRIEQRCSVRSSFALRIHARFLEKQVAQQIRDGPQPLVCGILEQPRLENAIQHESNTVFGQPAQLRRKVCNRRIVPGYRSKRRVWRERTQDRIDWAHALRRFRQEPMTHTLSELLPLKALGQLALTAQRAADQHRSEVGLPHETLDRVPVHRRGVGKELVDQLADGLDGGATEIELLNRPGRQHAVQRATYQRANGGAGEADQVHRVRRRRRRSKAGQSLHKVRALVRIVDDQNDGLQLNELVHFLAHQGLVVLEEEHVPATAAFLEASCQLERKATLAATRWRPHERRTAARSHALDELNLLAILAYQGTGVPKDSLFRVCGKIRAVVRLPVDEGAPARLPGKLVPTPLPKRPQRANELRTKSQIDESTP